MDVIVTIDTEADNQWDRSRADLSTENIEFIPRFQDLCDRHGLKPTYLCTWEVVEDRRFDAVLGYQEQARAEIGAHLHPWTTPPLRSKSGFDREMFGAYPSELDPGVLAEKLGRLTERIAARAGAAPRSYRAGRWGFDAAHVPILVSLGYTVDCSVTPLVSWEGVRGVAEGGPDFRRAPAAPYFLDDEDVCRPGRSALLEVPVTILDLGPRIARNERLRGLYGRHRRTLPGRALNKLFRLDPQWFRPFGYMGSERLIAVYEGACKAGLPTVEMMFHSSELMPGGSPYNPDEAAIEGLYDRLEAVFGRLRADGCTGVTLAEFAESRPGQSPD